VSLGKYSLLVTGMALTALGLAWPLALQRLSGDARAAVLFGAAVALANTIVAHGLVRWSAGRSTIAFFRAVLGGMVGRMAAMLAAVLAGMLWLRLPQLPLAAALLCGFVAFLVLELVIVHKGAARPAAVSR